MRMIRIALTESSQTDPSRQTYIENVQWFGEEFIARLRG